MQPALDRLVAVVANPVPEDALCRVLTADDGVGLRAAYFPMAEPASGTVVVLPGRAECIEKYFEAVGALRARGFAVVALDWRGQGGSARLLANPRKGHVDDFGAYRSDLAALFGWMEAMAMPRPWYGLAHSMGAAILIDALARGETRLSRAVLSAPMVGIADVQVNHPSARLAQALNLVGLGGLFVPFAGRKDASAFAPFDDNLLTSDRGRYERHVAVLAGCEDLVLGPPTIAWVAAAFRQMRAMREPTYALGVQCPSLFVLAGADRIVDSDDAEALAARMRGAAFVVIAGARHEILMEKDRFLSQFWAAFDAFIH